MNDPINPAIYDLLCLLEVSIRRLHPMDRPASVSVLLGQLDAERTAAKIAKALRETPAQDDTKPAAEPEPGNTGDAKLP